MRGVMIAPKISVNIQNITSAMITAIITYSRNINIDISMCVERIVVGFVLK